MILLNGQPAASINALDRGLQYGDGLFETIAVLGRQPLLWQLHMDRLEDGCRRLGLPPPDAEQLHAECVKANGDEARGVVKILLTRGIGGRGYRVPVPTAPTRLVMAFPWPSYPDDCWTTGAVARLCHTRLSRNPALAGIKHLNRLEQVLARAEWSDDSIAEGLMLDTEEQLVEGTMSNLFLVEGSKLVTPEVRECGVAGVMRSRLLASAAAMGIRCEITAVSLARAKAADALFLTNSIIGLWPVRRFDDRAYAMNTLVERLQQQLRQDHACA